MRKNLKPPKAIPNTTKNARRNFPPAAGHAAQQATGPDPATSQHSWLADPASPQWTGRKVRNKRTGKEYVIGDVFAQMHVEMENDAKTTIHTAASLRTSYEAC
jgi:hypothetical protein